MTTLPATAAPTGRVFLGVEQSVLGRTWRDRLDERGQGRAMAIAQRHALPELLARVLAGRGVEPDEVQSFLDPAIRTLLPDPDVLTAMP
ncbi:MAG TPA: single-stranded-DNA-specific exonuclease RecJ, partial [Pseudolabrys sp.]